MWWWWLYFNSLRFIYFIYDLNVTVFFGFMEVLSLNGELNRRFMFLVGEGRRRGEGKR